MAHEGSRPLTPGGRSLMQKKGASGGGAKKTKRGVWFQLNGRKFGDRGHVGSHLQGTDIFDIPSH